MKLAREEALKLHRQMWSDMQKDLGDCPEPYDRDGYKRKWCIKRFPNEKIMGYCFLCEYCEQKNYPAGDCSHCPIDWGAPDCSGRTVNHRYSPISEILALPERDE